jgi:predicted  nucleic acid-binding Zn-ribbon protein
MAKNKELSVEDKLRALYDLQLIDSRIDEIRNLRGELPMEVEDLEDEVAGLSTRLDKLKEDISTLNAEIATKKNTIEEAKGLMKKYAEQQKNVRNSREFNSLTKEIEFQELEIQLAEKHIREFKVKIEHKNESIEQTSEKLNARKEHLDHKNGLAVVSVSRGASGGSFFTLPPQVQVEIAARKRITTDEHSGRILVDPVLAEEETEKMHGIFDSIS